MAASTNRAKTKELRWSGIVKVQRSIVTAHDKPQVVIYNKDRSLFHQQNMPRAIAKLFKEDEFKFFAHATLLNGQLTINSRERWQQW